MVTTTTTEVQRVKFLPGQFLFREGEKSYFFYVVEEGEVEIFLEPKNGESEIILATVGEGQPVGEFALVVKKPRSASARAATACTAVKISEEGYRTLLKDLPDWAFSLIQSLIERIRTTDEMLRSNQTQQVLTLEKLEDILQKTNF